MNNSELKIIDAHVHLANTSAIEGFQKLMNSFNISMLNIACIMRQPYTNMAAFLFKAMSPDRIYVSAGLDYDNYVSQNKRTDFKKQAEQLMGLGADGMKMIEGKPNMRKKTGIPLDSDIYDDYYAYLEKNEIYILFHVADPEEFWDEDKCPESAKKMGWFWGDGTYPAKEELYRESENVLKKFPSLKVIFPHFYFLSADIDRAANFLDKWHKVSFDITPGSEMYYNFCAKQGEWQEFFIEYQDRIIFGTDNDASSNESIKWSGDNIQNVRKALETDEDIFEGKGLKLDKDVLKKIYADNFQKYAGKTPKQVNFAEVMQECNKIIDVIKDMPEQDQSVSELQTIIENRLF